MNLMPPPIQEPWAVDRNGVLISQPWILWMQSLVDGFSAEGLFSQTEINQTTVSSSSRTEEINQDDLGVLIMMSY